MFIFSPHSSSTPSSLSTRHYTPSATWSASWSRQGHRGAAVLRGTTHLSPCRVCRAEVVPVPCYAARLAIYTSSHFDFFRK